MFESEKNQRRVGRFAWVMAWVGLVVGQMHALSRFATAAGKEDLELPLAAAWAEPATDLLAPLLTWAGPDVVYVTYGKIWFPVFLAFTLCALVVHRGHGIDGRLPADYLRRISRTISSGATSVSRERAASSKLLSW